MKGNERRSYYLVCMGGLAFTGWLFFDNPVVSVVFAALGLFISIVFGTPVGSTIVIVDIVGFLVFAIIGLLNRRR